MPHSGDPKANILNNAMMNLESLDFHEEDKSKNPEQVDEMEEQIPLLTTPKEEVILFTYLALIDETIAAMLTKREEDNQRPIYYGIIFFNQHREDQPFKDILGSVDIEGRKLKCGIELSEFNIDYQPRRATKAWVLADFIDECTFTTNALSLPTSEGVGVLLIEPANKEE
ncbi:hypothetical protein V6N12_068732 [Hibiscus sabdariffa]|uniref:Uncharacterized protein n=1 Tax=Hibiscus sabdariffa TaxID=183260 RepID=A0ABR2FR52_9ROSI